MIRVAPRMFRRNRATTARPARRGNMTAQANVVETAVPAVRRSIINTARRASIAATAPGRPRRARAALVGVRPRAAPLAQGSPRKLVGRGAPRKVGASSIEIAGLEATKASHFFSEVPFYFSRGARPPSFHG